MAKATGRAPGQILKIEHDPNIGACATQGPRRNFSDRRFYT